MTVPIAQENCDLPNVSIVVIGYNEAMNLDETFQAIRDMDYQQDLIEVIYVDSGSNDNSVEIAQKYVDKCFIEAKHPSAGRNRNRGLIEAKYNIVHFIDGDLTIDKNYLKNIVHLFKLKDVQAITGIHYEIGKGPLNKINRLSDGGLNRKEGYTQFTSTGATYLKHSLLLINGYDERIIRGQEAEMGLRFIEAGHKIWCTENTMGYHKDGFTNVLKFLKRSAIVGKSAFQMTQLKGDNEYFRRARKRGKRQIVRTSTLIFLLVSSVRFGVLHYFLILYFLYNIYSTRSVYRRENPLSIVLLKVALKPFMNLFANCGFLKEALLFFLNLHDKEFYGLEKEILLVEH